jgi:hypothetical protein
MEPAAGGVGLLKNLGVACKARLQFGCFGELVPAEKAVEWLPQTNRSRARHRPRNRMYRPLNLTVLRYWIYGPAARD